MKYQYYLHNNVILRKEYFGGLVFSRDTGNTIDVDREAFVLLEFLGQNSGLFKNEIIFLLEKYNISISLNELTIMLKTLIANKIVAYRKTEYEDRNKDNLSYDVKSNWPKTNYISAPETVHWAATYRCDSNCPDCYGRRHRDLFQEINFEEVKTMIDKLVDLKVFQLAIGGGEALIRDDIVDVVRYATDNGLTVHITTNINNFDRQKVKEMSQDLTSIQFGIDANSLFSDKRQLGNLHLSFLLAKEMKLNTGVNLVLTKTVINNFEDIVKSLVEIGFRRIVLLRYKPHSNEKRWLQENVSPGEFKAFEPYLEDILRQYSNVKFRYDCALSFLQRKVDPESARKAGVRGCVAADRILAIGPDGSIYPCSQLVAEDIKTGNILEDDLSELIKTSKRLKKYRNYRNKAVFRSSICGICEAREHCGGCRVFSNNRKEEDIGCPEPIIGDKESPGKYGRRGDLKHYFKTHSYISVGTYMERYGVGQKKAVKELRNTRWLVKEYESDTGRKKSDCYVKWDKDTVYEVQDMIGYTSGGAPFATIDQVREWIKDDFELYPDWLKRINGIY